MSQRDSIPTVILVPKSEKPRRKWAGEQIPWAKIAVGATVVWMFVIGVLTIYFSLKDKPRRNDEEALNAMPEIRVNEREAVEKKPAAAAKADEEVEELGLAPAANGEFVECARIGTDVRFMKEPAEAFKRARDEKKMVFMFHLSGNLEDKEFT